VASADLDGNLIMWSLQPAATHRKREAAGGSTRKREATILGVSEVRHTVFTGHSRAARSIKVCTVYSVLSKCLLSTVHCTIYCVCVLRMCTDTSNTPPIHIHTHTRPSHTHTSMPRKTTSSSQQGSTLRHRASTPTARLCT